MPTPVNPHLLPVIAPPDLPEIARDAIDRLIVEANTTGADPAAHAHVIAHDMIESGRWRLDPTNDGDLGAAEWAMRLMAEAQANIEAMTRQHAEFVQQLDDWFAAEIERDRTTLSFFEPHLSHYQRQRRQLDERQATLKLPSGRVRSTRYQPSFDVDDEAVVIEWAKANGLGDQVVRKVETVRKGELNKLCQPVVVTEDGTPDGPIVDSYVEVRSIDDEPEAKRVPGVHVVAGHVDVKVVPR